MSHWPLRSLLGSLSSQLTEQRILSVLASVSQSLPRGSVCMPGHVLTALPQLSLPACAAPQDRTGVRVQGLLRFSLPVLTVLTCAQASNPRRMSPGLPLSQGCAGASQSSGGHLIPQLSYCLP